jgi:hypothetical protein
VSLLRFFVLQLSQPFAYTAPAHPPNSSIIRNYNTKLAHNRLPAVVSSSMIQILQHKRQTVCLHTSSSYILNDQGNLKTALVCLHQFNLHPQ